MDVETSSTAQPVPGREFASMALSGVRLHLISTWQFWSGESVRYRRLHLVHNQRCTSRLLDAANIAVSIAVDKICRCFVSFSGWGLTHCVRRECAVSVLNRIGRLL